MNTWPVALLMLKLPASLPQEAEIGGIAGLSVINDGARVDAFADVFITEVNTVASESTTSLLLPVGRSPSFLLFPLMLAVKVLFITVEIGHPINALRLILVIGCNQFDGLISIFSP